MTLGRVVAISEGGPKPPGPRPVEAMRMKAATDVATPVEAGTDELEVTITVAFAIA